MATEPITMLDSWHQYYVQLTAPEDRMLIRLLLKSSKSEDSQLNTPTTMRMFRTALRQLPMHPAAVVVVVESSSTRSEIAL